jgi:enoyl-CoA hydratase/carnithine racemase
MRLLVVGRLSGQLASAVKMAMAHGAKVTHVERADQATEQLRRGQGADLLMVDYQLDIAALIAANGPLAVAASKAIVRDSWLWPMEDLNAHQNPYVAPVFASEDAREGARAFAEKRAPAWQGK